MSFKKIYPWLLYILVLILTCFSFYYFTAESTTLGISIYLLTILLASFLTFKNIKIVSPLTFFSMILFSLAIASSTGMNTEEIIPTAINEQSYVITFALTCAFFLVTSCYWAVTNEGWKKILSIISILFFLLLSTIFGLTAPTFYTNFIYTRLFIAIVFGFYVFLTIKGRKFLRVLGILGLFSPLPLMFLGSVLFNLVAYPIEGEEKVEIVENMEGKAVEMLEYYNENDTENFCKYCYTDLVAQYEADTSVLATLKEEHGRYTEIGEVEIKKVAAYYYLQYPVTLENSETQQYFILLLADTGPDVHGFYISPDKY